MRWSRSLILSLWMVASGRILLWPGAAPVDPPSLLQASHGGSALPWWTPILVSVALITIALMYWWRHRPRPPADDEAEPVGPDRIEGLPTPADPAPAPPDDPAPFGLRGLLRPVPIA